MRKIRLELLNLLANMPKSVPVPKSKSFSYDRKFTREGIREGISTLIPPRVLDDFRTLIMSSPHLFKTEDSSSVTGLTAGEDPRLNIHENGNMIRVSRRLHWIRVKTGSSFNNRSFRSIWLDSIWFSTISFGGRVPSLTWRSLFAGKTLIFSDLFRCIGNGRTTKIWSDAWVPGVFPFTAQRPNAVYDGVEMVSDLMDEVGAWRNDILRGLFTAETIDKIQSIGLSCRQHDDKWVWLGDARGLFTVKVCYKHYMAAQLNDINLLPEIQGRIGAGFWKRLWKIPVLPKHKAFLWRTCLGILPTCSALARRGVDVDNKCVWCGGEEESAFHVLIECPLVQNFWTQSRFDFSSRRWHGTIVEWLEVEGSNWSREQWGICTIALYQLWEARNSKRFAAKSTNLDLLWCPVTLKWDEIQESGECGRVRDKEGTLCRWEKPSEGVFKLNTDAGTLPSGGGVIGGVVRNWDGQCTAAFAEKVVRTNSPMVLEAEAIRCGMEFALSQGIKDIVVESDAKLVVEFLASVEAQTSPLLQVCNQIKGLQQFFNNCSFSWVPRSCNKAAHFLVSFAKDSVHVARWVDSVPIILADVIRFDIE
ncbi:putative RNA-directed DNA polymerase [Senna tora]|uniref:Putative RNA-directed DNA polymerase n=1 Tax=Senna tora TaxID=362788 RepID=A0A834WLC2_9FABA|nr:putative RNA-directed DNA polymerase [Senna tora]